ncbi:hypothetical protein TM7_0453, partial [candidate division TM7 genomosp. GTL1]
GTRDGENFRHQIAHILLEHEKITEKNIFFKFDFYGFCSEIIGEEHLKITYYTTKIKQPRQKIPKALEKNIASISAANRRWVAWLTNQKIKVVKAGHLRVRESNACIHCGKRTLVLQEKGVDVRVATDLVHFARQKKGPIVLGSSDSDIVPALEVAAGLGAPIIYLCYASQLNRSVAAAASKVITFDDKDVLKYFGKKHE